MSIASVRCSIRVAVLLIAPAITAAQALDDVEFQLSVTRDPPVFRIGERIELNLRFSTTASGKYAIINSSAGRFAPIGEVYSLSPADGAVDPSEDERRLGFAGSFLSGIALLTDKPVDLHADLNQWFRFTRPGTYVITASSNRVSLQDHEGTPFENMLKVRSTPLELTIVSADAEWSDNQIRGIGAILDSDANPTEKTEAARRLSYMDSEAAAIEMARRYLRTKDSEFWRSELNRGLLDTRFRAAAIPILEESLNDSQQTVRIDAIQLLARMVASQEFRGKFPPPPRASERASQALIDTMSAYSKRINELVATYTNQVMATLPQRSGNARASAIYAAWESLEQYFQPEKDTPSANLIRLRDEVAAVAGDLTPNQQQQLLGFYWPRFPGGLLLPFVHDIATGEIGAEPFLREQAFKHWCDLEESDCEAALLAEIRKPATDLRTATLLLLPMKDHPELDALFTTRLASSPSRVAPLIARYGSPALAAAVRKALVGSPQANYCPVKENLLAYLLRVAPEEGAAAVVSALQKRSADSCYMDMLESIAQVNYTPALGRIAEAAIRDDPSSAVAGSAAEVLSNFGPPSAEQALWDRFTSWSEKWRDQAAKLRAKLGASDPYQYDRMLEYKVANGIANGKAWQISPADFGRLANLCVTASCRNMVENWQKSLVRGH